MLTGRKPVFVLLSDVHLIRPLWEDYKSTEAHKIEDTYDGHVSKILKRKVN